MIILLRKSACSGKYSSSSSLVTQTKSSHFLILYLLVAMTWDLKKKRWRNHKIWLISSQSWDKKEKKKHCQNIKYETQTISLLLVQIVNHVWLHTLKDWRSCAFSVGCKTMWPIGAFPTKYVLERSPMTDFNADSAHCKHFRILYISWRKMRRGIR